MWISNAEISGVYIVMANSNPQAVKKKLKFILNVKCFFLFFRNTKVFQHLSSIVRRKDYVLVNGNKNLD